MTKKNAAAKAEAPKVKTRVATSDVKSGEFANGKPLMVDGKPQGVTAEPPPRFVKRDKDGNIVPNGGEQESQSADAGATPEG